MDKILISIKFPTPDLISLGSMIWTFGELDDVVREWDQKAVTYLAEGAGVSEQRRANALQAVRQNRNLLQLESVRSGSAIVTLALGGIGSAISAVALDAYKESELRKRFVKMLNEQMEKRLNQTNTLISHLNQNDDFELEARALQLTAGNATANDKQVANVLNNRFHVPDMVARALAPEVIGQLNKFAHEDAVDYKAIERALSETLTPA